MRSLFIGRYQPFHKGHKTLIETELKKGNPVLIAVRDTKKSDKNPYSYMKRKKMIKKELKDWKKVEIMKIPDIAKVCYGRGVGYKIVKISLPEEIEKISATEIRNK